VYSVPERHVPCTSLPAFVRATGLDVSRIVLTILDANGVEPQLVSGILTYLSRAPLLLSTAQRTWEVLPTRRSQAAVLLSVLSVYPVLRNATDVPLPRTDLTPALFDAPRVTLFATYE